MYHHPRPCSLLRSLILALLLPCFGLLTAANPVAAAELVTLSEDNYADFAPRGKEARAFIGDYVLRNDRIELAVADPTLLSGRSASRWAIANVAGTIIDLTLRDQPNDQLIAFYPAPLRFKPDAPNYQHELIDERLAHTQPGRQPQQGQRVVLEVPAYEVENGKMLQELAQLPEHLRPAPRPYVQVRYILEDGWPYVLVETVYHNPTVEPFTVNPGAMLRIEGATSHELAEGNRLVCVYDKWWGQAYGVLAEEHTWALSKDSGRGLYTLRHMPAAGQSLSVPAGGELTIRRRVFPGRNLFDVKATAAELLGRPLREVSLYVVGPDAPDFTVPADVLAFRGDTLYAAGRTAADEDRLLLRLPREEFRLRVEAYGREPVEAVLEAGQEELTIECGEVARFRAEISEPEKDSTFPGRPIAARVRFTGRDGTPDPYFFPESGEQAVRNVYLTDNGTVDQVLPPGRYHALITAGPEFDPVIYEIDTTAPDEFDVLNQSLQRAYQTPGWIAADLHNHASLSGQSELFYVYPYSKDPTVDGDSTASPLGRVRSLLAEHIEFAVPAEHNFIADWRPLVEQLGVPDRLATAPGIGLTAGRRHTVTHQNVFPVSPIPGKQDGGVLQRPEHIGQHEWMLQWDDGAEKLVTIAVPRADAFGPQRGMDALDVIDLEPIVEGKPLSGRDNRILEWIELLNRGYRLPGVVGSGTFDNYHGAGGQRIYVKSPTDDPAKINVMDVVHEVEAGHVIMTTGPFLEVSFASENVQALPGDRVRMESGRGELRVRVLANRSVKLDRVQVLVGGERPAELSVTRESHPGLFRDPYRAVGDLPPGVHDPVQFHHAFPIALEQDNHLIVVASGTGEDLRPQARPGDKRVHAAVSNPIWIDAAEAGYRPHSPLEDAVRATLDFVQAPLAKPGSEPGRVRLTLRNSSPGPVSDSVTLQIVPEGAARIVGPATQTYTLPHQGAQTHVDWKIAFEDDFLAKNFPVFSTYNNTGRFGVRVERGEAYPGRNAAAMFMNVDHHVGSIAPLDEPAEVEPALADQVDYPVMVPRGPRAATMRFAVSGDHLAVWADVTEAELARHEIAWEGSCIEVFACMPGRHPKNRDLKPGMYYPINQVYLLPEAGGQPAVAYRREDDRIVPAPEIAVTSERTGKGYRLSALVPLSTLKVDVDEIIRFVYFEGVFTDVSLLGLEARPGRFLLEARVNTVAQRGGDRLRGRIFLSNAPHVDSHSFGRMRPVGKVEAAVEVVRPLSPDPDPGSEPGRVRVTIHNYSDQPAKDSAHLVIEPEGAAEVVQMLGEGGLTPSPPGSPGTAGGEGWGEGDLPPRPPALRGERAEVRGEGSSSTPAAPPPNRIAWNLPPGEEAVFDFDIRLTGSTPVNHVNLILPRSSGGELIGAPSPRMKVVGRALPQVAPLTDAVQVKAALADLPAYPMRLDNQDFASVRFALAGDHLAVWAAVREENVSQHDSPWKASDFEVFGSRAGEKAIGQVFLVPATGSAPPKALRSHQGRMPPAPDVRLDTTLTDDGYELQALIPLELLTLDPTLDHFLLEFQVTTQIAGQRQTATAFGSPRAYQDNSLYGRFDRGGGK